MAPSGRWPVFRKVWTAKSHMESKCSANFLNENSSRRTSSVPKKVVSAQKVIQAGHDPIISISDARAYLARETANQRLESKLLAPLWQKSLSERVGR